MSHSPRARWPAAGATRIAPTSRSPASRPYPAANPMATRRCSAATASGHRARGRAGSSAISDRSYSATTLGRHHPPTADVRRSKGPTVASGAPARFERATHRRGRCGRLGHRALPLARRGRQADSSRVRRLSALLAACGGSTSPRSESTSAEVRAPLAGCGRSSRHRATTSTASSAGSRVPGSTSSPRCRSNLSACNGSRTGSSAARGSVGCAAVGGAGNASMWRKAAGTAATPSTTRPHRQTRRRCVVPNLRFASGWLGRHRDRRPSRRGSGRHAGRRCRCGIEHGFLQCRGKGQRTGGTILGRFGERRRHHRLDSVGDRSRAAGGRPQLPHCRFQRCGGRTTARRRSPRERTHRPRCPRPVPPPAPVPRRGDAPAPGR